MERAGHVAGSARALDAGTLLDSGVEFHAECSWGAENTPADAAAGKEVGPLVLARLHVLGN